MAEQQDGGAREPAADGDGCAHRGSWLDAAFPDQSQGQGDTDTDTETDDDADVQTVSLKPRRTTRTRRIVLTGVMTLGLAGSVLFGSACLRIVKQKDASLRPPEAIAGLKRDDSANAVETAANLRTALAAGVDLDNTVAVVYLDPANEKRSVFFFGGTRLLFSPGKELDRALGLLGEDGAGAPGMRKMGPGELGGIMKCGTVSVPDGAMSACGWADHGSVGVAMFPERTIDQAADLMRQLRDSTETRS